MTDLLLHAWLISDKGDGAAFLADVWRMLTRVAERDGCTLETTATLGPLSDTSRLAGVAGAPSRLLRETGVHRALRVPADSTNGRVTTSLVGVEVLPLDATPSSTTSPGEVLKTYNYIQGRVVRHASGNRGSLAEGLEGDV